MRMRVILLMAGGLLAVGLVSYTVAGRLATMSPGVSGEIARPQPVVRTAPPVAETATAVAETPQAPTETPVAPSSEEPPQVMVSQAGVVPATEAPPFDAERFAADPDSYLAEVDGRRVLQTAQPGVTVPQLAPHSPRRMTVSPDGTATLRVRTAPLAPATFSSFDGGTFTNGRSTISVRADDDGIATTRWRPSAGTVNIARVTVASPSASGRVMFSLTVAPALASSGD